MSRIELPDGKHVLASEIGAISVLDHWSRPTGFCLPRLIIFTEGHVNSEFYFGTLDEAISERDQIIAQIELDQSRESKCQTGSGWFNADEIDPPASGLYLIYVKIDHGEFCGVGGWRPNEWYPPVKTGTYKITHWMHLPPPP